MKAQQTLADEATKYKKQSQQLEESKVLAEQLQKVKAMLNVQPKQSVIDVVLEAKQSTEQLQALQNMVPSEKLEQVVKEFQELKSKPQFGAAAERFRQLFGFDFSEKAAEAVSSSFQQM